MLKESNLKHELSKQLAEDNKSEEVFIKRTFKYCKFITNKTIFLK